MMMNAISSTPATTTSGGTTPAPIGLQGQSTLGFGSSYGYNPYPSPYPTGLPGSSIMGMNAYGGNYGGNYGGMMGMNTYGGNYGNMMGMGNPYGGYQNATGTGGLNPQTGLANGYGFETAVAPTVFQGALSGDGTLPYVNPGRIAQEFIGRDNGEKKSNVIGLGAGLATFGACFALPGRLKPSAGVPQLLLALGLSAFTGFTAKFATQKPIELLSKNVALSQDYADNGHIDSSRLLQNNFQTDINLFNNVL
jgi:hypothetical protein